MASETMVTASHVAQGWRGGKRQLLVAPAMTVLPAQCHRRLPAEDNTGGNAADRPSTVADFLAQRHQHFGDFGGFAFT
ncbi:MAG: hypothetical protein R2873_05705 [Caldilineaceae bacterium]